MGPIPPASQCRVLIVDDDRAAAEEYAESVRLLGYQAEATFDAATALRRIAADAQIGIVISDIDMPGMSGLSLLDEIAARFAATRDIVALVITGYGGLDAAIEAMRSEAIDFLRKPLCPEDLAAALRRAIRRWQQHQNARLTAANLPISTADAPGHAGVAEPGEADEAATLLRMVRMLIRLRERRGEFLDPQLFSDPVWDILLDLTSASLEGKVSPVSSVCLAARVPMSTALRHIRHLVKTGMVRRWQDPDDRRRDLLELQPEARAAMLDYIRATAARVSSEATRQPRPDGPVPPPAIRRVG